MTRPNKIISLILTFAIILTSLIFNNQDFSAKSYFDDNFYFEGDHVHFGFWNKNPQGEHLNGGKFKLTNKYNGNVLYSNGNVQTKGDSAYTLQLIENEFVTSQKIETNYLTKRTLKFTPEKTGYYKIEFKGYIDRLYSSYYNGFLHSELNLEDNTSFGYLYLTENKEYKFYIDSKEDIDIKITKIESLKYNTPITFNINNKSDVFLAFESGDLNYPQYYVIEYSNSNYFIEYDIVNADSPYTTYFPESLNSDANKNIDYFDFSHYSQSYPIEDNFHIIFSFENTENIDENFTVTVRTLTEDEKLQLFSNLITNSIEINLDEEILVNSNNEDFKFTPEESGYYSFMGYNITTTKNVSGWIKTDENLTIVNDYNYNSENGDSYTATAYLESGITYYLYAQTRDNIEYYAMITKATEQTNILETNNIQLFTTNNIQTNEVDLLSTVNTSIINGTVPENSSFDFELNAENEGSTLIFTFTPSKTGKYSFKAERNYPDTENNYYYKYGYIFSQIVEIEGEDSYVAYLGEDNEKMVLLNANQTYYIRWENNWDNPAYYGTYTITNNLINEIEQFENNKEYTTNSSLLLSYTISEAGLYSFEFDFNNKIERNIYFQIKKEDGSYSNYGYGEADFWVNTNYEENIDYARTYIEANQTILVNVEIYPTENILETTLISKVQKLDDTGLIGFIDTYLESESIYDENDNFVKRIDSCEWILEQVVAPEGYSLNTKKYEIRYEEITYSDYSTEEKLYIDGVDTFLAPWDFINEPLRDEGAIITFATNLAEPLNLILTNNETQEIIFGSFNTEKTTLNLPAGTYILKQINNPTIILNSISLENEIEGVSLTFENNEYILTISENINNSIPLLIENEENHDRGYIDLSNKENLFKPNNPTSGPSGEPYVSDSVLIYGNWYQGSVAE